MADVKKIINRQRKIENYFIDKQKKIEIEHLYNFIRELYRDLEVKLNDYIAPNYIKRDYIELPFDQNKYLDYIVNLTLPVIGDTFVDKNTTIAVSYFKDDTYKSEHLKLLNYALTLSVENGKFNEDTIKVILKDDSMVVIIR